MKQLIVVIMLLLFSTSIMGTYLQRLPSLHVTGVATLGDGSLLNSAAAPTTDSMIANKKYVDDSIYTDPMTTRGDVLVRDASNVTARLGIGTNGQVLSSDGTDVSWVTPSGGGTGMVKGAATKTADYTVGDDDYCILIDASSGAVDITLPTAVGNNGRIYVVKAIDITNAAVVEPDGSETIEGAANYTFQTQYDSISFVSNGANWFIL